MHIIEVAIVTSLSAIIAANKIHSIFGDENKKWLRLKNNKIRVPIVHNK